MATRIRRIVIVGGGTAGWMAAASLARILGTRNIAITLVESEEIGTVGVGEATIPPIALFNKLLGIDEDEFVRETEGTFKLGIEFVDWARLDHSYLHSFGLFGVDMNGISFTHYWLRAMKAGSAGDRDLFNAEAEAARLGRFARTPPNSPPSLPRVNYAFQFDAARYAAYLRRYSEALGVVRTEGRIVSVDQAPESGLIEAVQLADGRRIEGDFFIDCSGFRGLLIEGKLQAGYDDWSRWLPCDRAWAVPTANVGPPSPYTRSTAYEAGWQWRIPLQHRTGNGYVFSSGFVAEEEAREKLLGRVDGERLAEPRLLKFVAGRRRRSWIGNCLALGLAGGFLEPLESTSIHLVQAALAKFLAFFPAGRIDDTLVDRFNAEMNQLYEGIRDFLIAHYKITEREDSAFWRYCRHMEIPDTLQARLHLFRSRGEVMPGGQELFREVNWFSILHGQGLVPEDYHPVADALAADVLAQRLSQIRAGVKARVDSMPRHDAFIAQCCASPRSRG
jgi:tryptophan halogenase